MFRAKVHDWNGMTLNKVAKEVLNLSTRDLCFMRRMVEDELDRRVAVRSEELAKLDRRADARYCENVAERALREFRAEG